ncbi:hypothetical protein HRR83_003732 [Exophiala dermatitidis]|uniref:Serine/threonine kinase 16 n=2 Tax=Exophiala dermatitidis TaxID=5970 RepID=H6BP72_EXODN|nr:serine/threonine kinase 16 [Exophiala dermatitidis NIH/UT8656]KAJ4522303.1 hypothetical protein HRR74_002886 [Exophiala dermatitidis]EHY53527.1 serine/threonine kinase 16 [Exophiala dermatitidis NIH/UT8656]KAJ4529628.1 hypothetical protein HRR73_000654 [Exophiala dermatitidis]KAJ4543208.1 hypothetical protein HRR77_005465 [Exophiala dermatitidis]KAJ4543707.1 hypothetical protein HRR76_001773 [Exophiala dermatitidis]
MANTAVLEDIRHVAEAETHVEMLPGTELMAEVAGIHLVHAHNRPNATVLVPQPTASPHDPLNWSKLWKTIVLTNQGLFVLASIITTLSIAPLTPVYMAEWNKSLTQVNLLTGVTVLCLGYANFVIIPCSDIFGRRPTLLVCALISLASCIWQALAKSYHSFLGARVLAGLGPAANESIMATVVADLYFLHQRGRYVGVYFWCYFVGLMIGPIISGNVAAHVSWRWFFWACTIVQVVEIVGLLLFSPETRRLLEQDPVAAAGLVQQPSLVEGGDDKAPADEIVENEQREVEVEVVENANANAIVDEHLGRGRPSRSQFNVIQPIDRRATAFATILRHVLTPVQIFAYPIIFWAAMSMGAAANALLCVNLAQSQALAAPPYNFTPANVGFANFALAVGAIVGLATAGPFSDWVAMRATKRNKGIREPEQRLPALVPFLVASVVGMVIIGVGFDRQWPWEPIIIVGFTLAGVLTVSIPTIAITYAIDCYKPISGQIMVTSTVAKNTFGFGMTYYINDWAAESGFTGPFMLLMGMTVGFSLVGMVVLMVYGKTFRRWTKDAKVHSFG